MLLLLLLLLMAMWHITTQTQGTPFMYTLHDVLQHDLMTRVCCCVPAGLRPPVIHRDIKPENVVVEGGKWGGRVYLIDFGGVQGSSGIGGCCHLATMGWLFFWCP